MSESPFETFAVAEAPAVEEGKSNSKALLALGAVGVLALAGGAYFLLAGGSAEEESFSVPTASRPAVVKPTAAPKPVLVPAVVTADLGRNPFKALYVQPAVFTGDSGSTADAPPVAPPQAAPVTPTTTTPVTPVVVLPPAGGSGSTGGGTTTPPAPAPAPAPARQSTVSLKGVAVDKTSGKPTGTFVYDGTELTGVEGDVMGGKLLVLSLQQDQTGAWFANLQLGDGSPFEVHQRQTVVVQ